MCGLLTSRLEDDLVADVEGHGSAHQDGALGGCGESEKKASVLQIKEAVQSSGLYNLVN